MAAAKEKLQNAEDEPLTDDDDITLESSHVNADALSIAQSKQDGALANNFDDAVSQVPTELLS